MEAVLLSDVSHTIVRRCGWGGMRTTVGHDRDHFGCPGAEHTEQSVVQRLKCLD